MGWIKYLAGPKSRTDEPRMSVWSKGQIAFNKPSIDKFKMTQYSHCLLYVDKDLKKIGIKLTDADGESGKMKLKKYKWGYLIGAKNFIKSCGIVTGKTRQLHPFWDDKEHMIVAVYG